MRMSAGAFFEGGAHAHAVKFTMIKGVRAGRAPLLITHARFEDGTTHAAAADWLGLAERTEDPALRLCAVLVDPLGHLSWDSRGATNYRFCEEIPSFEARSFIAAVSEEREADAIATLRGALELDTAMRRPVFASAALTHYADFGHSAISVLKSFELITRLGPENLARGWRSSSRSAKPHRS